MLDFFKSKGKIILQILFAILLISYAIYFFKNEGIEFAQVRRAIASANRLWILFGILITFVYILLQGLMYLYSYKTFELATSWKDCTLLFLKRNLVSVFLPAGGITSLALFNGELNQDDNQKEKVVLGSTLYGIIGIASVIIIAIPVLLFQTSAINGLPIAQKAMIGSIASFGGLLFLLYSFIRNKEKIGTYLSNHYPKLGKYLSFFYEKKMDNKALLYVVLISLAIDFIGVIQLYVALAALGVYISWGFAVLGYTIAVLLLIVSPFLRGAGAIEMSIAYLLHRAGYSIQVTATATLLFRLYEFWLPLFVGLGSFLLQFKKLLLRVLPIAFVFILGVIDITSVLTPPNQNRILLEHEFFTLRIMQTSNYFVLMAGLFLLMNTIFLYRGLRVAYITAILLCCISIIGNLLKSFDYEEAISAVVVLITLIFSAKYYRIKSRFELSKRSGQLILVSFVIVLIYGLSFSYYFNKVYWNSQLSFSELFLLFGKSLCLLRNSCHLPKSETTRYFFYSLNIYSFGIVCYLLFMLLRPKYTDAVDTDEKVEAATDLLYKMRQSANDLFKVWSDKHLYIGRSVEGFVSYKTYKNYAVVLEGPVVSDVASSVLLMQEFERFCKTQNLKTYYYRVPQSLLPAKSHAQSILIGQEAILDLNKFSLSGKSMKSIRNAINNCVRHNMQIKVYEPPIKGGLLQQLQLVSDTWLKENNRKEILFSQGSFESEMLKEQHIFTVENEEGKIFAFLNMLTTFGRQEATYDLLRYLPDAPNGVVDYLLINFFEYLKNNGFQKVDIGFVPFAGIQEKNEKNFFEKTIKLSYEKLPSIASYQKGIWQSKDKFKPDWENRYLIYQDELDLLKFPMVLKKIVRYND